MIGLISLIAIQDAATHAIVDVSIVDPGSDSVRTGQTVLFNERRILGVSDTRSAKTEGLAVLDGKRKFLIPGLWDMHVHLLNEQGLGLFPAFGVTGVRVMFGNPTHLQWRKNIREGKTFGPEMVVASPIVDGPKPIWNGSIAVATPEQGREAVRKIKKNGYDFVKVYSLLSKDAFYAIADESAKQGLSFAGHVPHSVGILEAQKAGQKSSEHVMGVTVECTAESDHFHGKFGEAAQLGREELGRVSLAASKKIIAGYSPEKERELIGALKDGSMWQCPTLVVLRNIANLDDPNFGKSGQLKYVPAFLRATWDPKQDFRFKDRKAEDWERSRKTYASTFGFTKRMIAGGARILAGTDALNPYVYAGYSLHEELQLLVQAGMKPTEALAAATTGPAEFLGKGAALGKIAVGYEPTLVLLDANPLESISNTLKIQAVINKGRVLTRNELDKELAAREYR